MNLPQLQLCGAHCWLAGGGVGGVYRSHRGLCAGRYPCARPAWLLKSTAGAHKELFFGLYRILTFSDFHVDFMCSLNEDLLSFLLLGIWTKRHCNRPATCNMEQHGEKHRLQGNTGQLPLQICRWAGQKVTESTSYLITIFPCSYSSRSTLNEWREPSED